MFEKPWKDLEFNVIDKYTPDPVEETNLPIVTFNVPEDILRRMFLGKPGDTLSMAMTPEFQELLERRLESPLVYSVTVTFKNAPRDTITATFEFVDIGA